MEKVMEKIIEETLNKIKKNIGNNIDKSDRFISETEIIQHFNDKNTNKCIKSVHFSKTTPIKKLQEITFTGEEKNVIKEIIWYEYNKATNKLIKTTTYNNNNNNNIIKIDDNINNTITTETYYLNGKIKERIIKDKKYNNIISIENFNENGICTSATAYDTEGQKTFEREFYEDGETVKCLHIYKNGKRIKSESFDEKNNKIEEQILDNNEHVMQITKFCPNKEKDLEIFFNKDGKIEKLNTYYENKCNRKYTFQNIVNFDRNEFLNLSTVERENQLDQLIETNTKYYTEYDNGNKINETFYRKNGTVEKIINYTDGKKFEEYYFREDGETLEKAIQYTSNKECLEIIFKKDGKTAEKMINYRDGKKFGESYFREDGKTIKKAIFYENDEKTIKNIVFCDVNNKAIDIVDKTKLQELLKDLDNNKCDIETLTMSIDEEDNSIKHYSVCDKTNENIKHVINYKYDKKYKVTRYKNDKEFVEFYFREDGETVEKIINYTDGKKISESYFREDGKTTEKIINYTDGKKIREAYFREDNKTIEKIIFYENDDKTINKIVFYDVNSEVIDIVDKTKLQELLKDLDNNKCDIETLTMSIDEEDNSIKHYSACDETNKNIRYAFTYKDDKKVKTTQIIDENNELQNTLSSVQGASDELPDKEQDDLLQSHLINL